MGRRGGSLRALGCVVLSVLLSVLESTAVVLRRSSQQTRRPMGARRCGEASAQWGVRTCARRRAWTRIGAMGGTYCCFLAVGESKTALPRRGGTTPTQRRSPQGILRLAHRRRALGEGSPYALIGPCRVSLNHERSLFFLAVTGALDRGEALLNTQVSTDHQ